MKILKEVLEELLLVFKGKTLDVLIPPVLFLVVLNAVDLIIALVVSTIASVFFFIIRVRKKENLTYSVMGLVGVIFAMIITIISNNASNFFLPDIIGTSTLIVITIVSLITKRPIASYVSHITRGWDYNWFQRSDVKPAYMEVSFFWLMFFSIRLMVEIYLYITSSVDDLVFANIILGFPVTIGVLVISYIYGITRLHQLGGPGVDEFMKGEEPPYRGQTRGF